MNEQALLDAIAEMMDTKIKPLKEDIAGIKVEMAGVKEDVAGIKVEMAGVKEDVAGIKVEMAGVKEDVAGIKVEMTGVKEDVTGLKSDVATLKQELRKDIQHDMMVLLETEVKTWFNLVAEGLESVKTKMPSEEDMDIIDGSLQEHEQRITHLETVVEEHAEDISKLKKAE